MLIVNERPEEMTVCNILLFKYIEYLVVVVFVSFILSSRTDVFKIHLERSILQPTNSVPSKSLFANINTHWEPSLQVLGRGRFLLLINITQTLSADVALVALTQGDVYSQTITITQPNTERRPNYILEGSIVFLQAYFWIWVL